MSIRALDISLALAAVIFALPLIALVAALVFAFDPGPVIFAQRRIGKDGKTFRCFKFRTMVTDAQDRLLHLLEESAEAREEWAKDQKLRNDPRVIGIGRFLRKTSLDELPQLFNVLKGDMSLVGPRPIIESEVIRYGSYFRYYCAVQPGITGLWQISGRNDTSYRRRVAYDVAYSRSRSLGLNIKILAYTLPSVLFAKGSY